MKFHPPKLTFFVMLFLLSNITFAQDVQSLLLQGEYNEASIEGEKLLKQTPNNLKLLKQTGIACLHADRYKEAAHYLNLALVQDTSDYKTMNQLANAYSKLSLSKKAISLYEKSLQTAPDNTTALMGIAKLYFRENKYSKADFYYSSLERIFPEKSVYSRKRSICMLKMGDTMFAYPKMKEAYRKDTTDLTTVIALTRLQIRGGFYDLALGIITEHLKTYPDHQKLNYLAGRSHFGKNHHYRALPYWKKLLANEDSSYQTLHHAGRSFHATFKHAKAVELLTKAYAIDNSNEPLVRALGDAHYKLHNYDAALKYILAEKKLVYPKNTQERFLLEKIADRYKAAGKYQKAIDGYRNMAVILEARGMKYYSKARVQVCIARVYDEGLKDKKNAIKYYQKYLEKEGDKISRKAVEDRITFLKEQLHFERKSK